MINFKEVLKNISKTKLGLASTASEQLENTSVSTYRRAQERRWLYICLIIFGVLGIAMKLQGGNGKKVKDEENVSAKGHNIATSYDAMDGNKIWQNHFEDKLRNSQYELQEKVKKVIHDMRAKEEEERKHRDQEMQKIAKARKVNKQVQAEDYEEY